MKTKKLILSMFVISLLSISCFAKEKLSWGMDSKKLKKKVNIEKSYKNDFCEILYLPKNSIFQNEYDEYLLFTNEDGLISRLQKKDTSYEDFEKSDSRDYFKVDYYRNYANDTYFTKRVNYFNSFPDEFSFEVTASLFNKYDYSKTESVSACDSEQERIINCNGKVFLLQIYLLLDSWTGRRYVYDDFIKRNDLAIKQIFDDFETHCKVEEQKYIEESQKKNPGPFGTWWGMSKEDLHYICKDEKILSTEITDINKLKEKINYSDYYSIFSRAGITTVKKFEPQKSVDSISEYYAIFDNENGLYQVFSIANHSRALKTKEMYENNSINQKKFSDLKLVLTEQYGSSKGNSDNTVFWITDKGIKIELLSESKLVKLYSYWDGKEYGGQDDYTCLIYTDMKKYNALLNSENKLVEQEKQEQFEAAKKKENEQKSFF